ncbi:hypothetical protein LOY38_19440 [Pseudomonas sp. B21-015]|uniref:hypothetical protein n=1 Tax=Pseudomonas sp. B21-015 TaxID=2895473 RepID=UPI00215EB2E6|nr:hypothetical protein [Pseudomonas sp. B21-015]UVM48545.1 hypothetical protein LOY38_19440 [Pseudomonas sp. B21-015]
MSGCGYEHGDWECREGGFLFDAGSGEGWDPQDETYICPHCRTRDYLDAAKDDAESCSKWSNCGSSGTGLDIWAGAESRALIANEPAARKALSEIGVVGTLVTDQSTDGYSVVLCNTQQVTP